MLPMLLFMVVLEFEFCADAVSIARLPKIITASSAKTNETLFIFVAP